MKASNFIWWYRLGLDHTTTRVMPSRARITQGATGVFISYPDNTKRWISNDWHD